MYTVFQCRNVYDVILKQTGNVACRNKNRSKDDVSSDYMHGDDVTDHGDVDDRVRLGLTVDLRLSIMSAKRHKVVFATKRNTLNLEAIRLVEETWTCLK